MKRISNSPAFHRAVTNAKKFWYGDRGEPIQYRSHKLRFIPGTRPVRLHYGDSPDVTVRNDVKQITFFLENIRAGDFVLDVGGHFGQYAVLLGALTASSGRVVSFEPDPVARKILHSNLGLNGLSERVTVESLALFDTPGEHSFFSKGADSMSSLMRSGLGSNSGSSEVKEYRVKTVPLDDYLGERGLGMPRWIKLDTEGAEINILRGAREVLRSDATIVCELHPYAWEEFGTSFAELLEIVRRAGKTIEYLDRSIRITDGAFYGAAIIK
jgi:FkbM family methyltransferase